MPNNKGMVHFYTGNGKGKTTAALGLALRSAGRNKRIFIAQFVKGMHYAELDSIKKHESIELKQFGRDCFIENEPVEDDILAAKKGFEEVKSITTSNKYDLVILDEIFIAMHYNLISYEEVVELIKSKNQHLELVLTGRNAPESLYAYADLITEMKEIKHYYNEGVKARSGIEY
ncbi:MAG: cob(I)yrinic acid a,c-diamide adenosyltransferase [Bacteroidales bacterium]|nr:cob(I)yrinic acid a,c-diamide adenosyltransferase [Bacteroidales bacterium]